MINPLAGFFDRLAERAVAHNTLLCVGLDPHPEFLTAETPQAARDFCLRIIEATSDLVCAYKPNSAFFEALGTNGMQALKEVITAIPDGIPVAMGGADQPCAALGNGVLDPGTFLATIGTGGQLFAPVSAPEPSPGLALTTFCHLPETRWYVMGATLAGGLCLRWLREKTAPSRPLQAI